MTTLQPSPGTPLLDDLGDRLRKAREARRLTLDDVAESARLTKGYLSKVERNQATPSVAVLVRICEALGFSLGQLFDPQIGRDIIRRDQREPIHFGGVGLHESLLSPTHERRVQVIHSTLEPSGGSGNELYTLPCDVEFAYVIQGKIELTLGNRTEILNAGDAMTFSADEGHSFANPDPLHPAEMLWVLSPALPAGWDQVD